MIKIWIMIFLLIFLFIYNLQGFIEGFPPGENADNPWSSPPVGPQPDREDVPPPPLKPPPDAKIKPVVPGRTEPIKPTCECFDSQTEIFLNRNTNAFRQLEEDVKIIKKKIQEANKKIGENYDGIEQNKDYDIQMCCATGKVENCKNLNKYDCQNAIKI